MARNKYPEETQNLILETAQRLFMEKGFENTSVQDIINNLGGLSKGAIYHHFKSKEEILLAIMNRMDANISRDLHRICEEKGLNGYEKLKKLFRESIRNSDKDIAFLTAPDLMKNPKMLVLHLKSIFEEEVPGYIQPILEEGVRDGSIQTDYPKELAEVFMLLSNLWINPLVFGSTMDLESMMRRVEFYRHLTQQLGLDLVDDEMIDRLRQLGESYYSRKFDGTAGT